MTMMMLTEVQNHDGQHVYSMRIPFNDRFMKLRLDRVLEGEYEAETLDEALASNPVELKFEKPETWTAPYPKYEYGWWKPFLPPQNYHLELLGSSSSPPLGNSKGPPFAASFGLSDFVDGIVFAWSCAFPWLALPGVIEERQRSSVVMGNIKVSRVCGCGCRCGDGCDLGSLKCASTSPILHSRPECRGRLGFVHPKC
eukprot:Gb_09920 [translate_table: standard]